MKKKIYVIYVNDQPIKVTKKIYTIYWKDREREKYLDKLHRRNIFVNLDDVFEGGDINSIEYELVKDEESPRDVAIKSEMIHEILSCIRKLPKSDRALIDALYYQDLTQAEYAEGLKVSQQYISYKHRQIIEKLKKMTKF